MIRRISYVKKWQNYDYQYDIIQELIVKETCKYLGISRDTALRWIASQNMPAHKIEKMEV